MTPHRDTTEAGTVTVPILLHERAYALFKRGMDTQEITDWLNDRGSYYGARFTEALVYSALAQALDDKYEGRS